MIGKSLIDRPLLPKTIAHSRGQPRSVYLHIPFCRHRCGYCNFTLVTDRDHWIDDYLDAMQTETETALDGRDRPEIDTVFIGGGTPTHLSPRQLSRLLAIVIRYFCLSDRCEFSIEANPGDIDDRITDELAKGQVNRVSLGVQSFDAQKLSFLERDHDAKQVRVAVARVAKFTQNISIDLIFGVQDETLDTWKADIQSAIELPNRAHFDVRADDRKRNSILESTVARSVARMP